MWAELRGFLRGLKLGAPIWNFFVVRGVSLGISLSTLRGFPLISAIPIILILDFLDNAVFSYPPDFPVKILDWGFDYASYGAAFWSGVGAYPELLPLFLGFLAAYPLSAYLHYLKPDFAYFKYPSGAFLVVVLAGLAGLPYRHLLPLALGLNPTNEALVHILGVRRFMPSRWVIASLAYADLGMAWLAWAVPA